jgi:hypothetical protein
MLRKDDPVYYKVKLQQLLNLAVENGVKIELGLKEVSFISDSIYPERASARPIIK